MGWGNINGGLDCYIWFSFLLDLILFDSRLFFGFVSLNTNRLTKRGKDNCVLILCYSLFEEKRGKNLIIRFVFARRIYRFAISLNLVHQFRACDWDNFVSRMVS